jgi:anti-sigma B factor antagonist
MGQGLRIKLETVDKKIILHLDGRLDASSSSVLEEKLHQLIKEKHIYLLLDFALVHYLSSAGLRVLLSAFRELKEKKGCLLVFSMTEEVAEIVRMAGFDRILHIFPSEKEAFQFHLK